MPLVSQGYGSSSLISQGLGETNSDAPNPEPRHVNVTVLEVHEHFDGYWYDHPRIYQLWGRSYFGLWTDTKTKPDYRDAPSNGYMPCWKPLIDDLFDGMHTYTQYHLDHIVTVEAIGVEEYGLQNGCALHTIDGIFHGESVPHNYKQTDRWIGDCDGTTINLTYERYGSPGDTTADPPTIGYHGQVYGADLPIFECRATGGTTHSISSCKWFGKDVEFSSDIDGTYYQTYYPYDVGLSVTGGASPSITAKSGVWSAVDYRPRWYGRLTASMQGPATFTYTLAPRGPDNEHISGISAFVVLGPISAGVGATRSDSQVDRYIKKISTPCVGNTIAIEAEVAIQTSYKILDGATPVSNTMGLPYYTSGSSLFCFLSRESYGETTPTSSRLLDELDYAIDKERSRTTVVSCRFVPEAGQTCIPWIKLKSPDRDLNGAHNDWTVIGSGTFSGDTISSGSSTSTFTRLYTDVHRPGCSALRNLELGIDASSAGTVDVCVQFSSGQSKWFNNLTVKAGSNTLAFDYCVPSFCETVASPLSQYLSYSNEAQEQLAWNAKIYGKVASLKIRFNSNTLTLNSFRARVMSKAQLQGIPLIAPNDGIYTTHGQCDGMPAYHLRSRLSGAENLTGFRFGGTPERSYSSFNPYVWESYIELLKTEYGLTELDRNDAFPENCMFNEQSNSSVKSLGKSYTCSGYIQTPTFGTLRAVGYSDGYVLSPYDYSGNWKNYTDLKTGDWVRLTALGNCAVVNPGLFSRNRIVFELVYGDLISISPIPAVSNTVLVSSDDPAWSTSFKTDSSDEFNLFLEKHYDARIGYSTYNAGTGQWTTAVSPYQAQISVQEHSIPRQVRYLQKQRRAGLQSFLFTGVITYTGGSVHSCRAPWGMIWTVYIVNNAVRCMLWDTRDYTSDSVVHTGTGIVKRAQVAYQPQGYVKVTYLEDGIAYIINNVGWGEEGKWKMPIPITNAADIAYDIDPNSGIEYLAVNDGTSWWCWRDPGDGNWVQCAKICDVPAGSAAAAIKSSPDNLNLVIFTVVDNGVPRKFRSVAYGDKWAEV